MEPDAKAHTIGLNYRARPFFPSIVPSNFPSLSASLSLACRFLFEKPRIDFRPSGVRGSLSGKRFNAGKGQKRGAERGKPISRMPIKRSAVVELGTRDLLKYTRRPRTCIFRGAKRNLRCESALVRSTITSITITRLEVTTVETGVEAMLLSC